MQSPTVQFPDGNRAGRRTQACLSPNPKHWFTPAAKQRHSALGYDTKDVRREHQAQIISAHKIVGKTR